jgi:1,6-anhydro-N-acetylmuramate kinase
MTREEFCKLGEALRGPHWQRSLSADLDRDERTVRHYASGTRPIPEDIAKRLVGLCYAHADTLRKLAHAIPIT